MLTQHYLGREETKSKDECKKILAEDLQIDHILHEVDHCLKLLFELNLDSILQRIDQLQLDFAATIKKISNNNNTLNVHGFTSNFKADEKSSKQVYAIHRSITIVNVSKKSKIAVRVETEQSRENRRKELNKLTNANYIDEFEAVGFEIIDSFGGFIVVFELSRELRMKLRC